MLMREYSSQPLDRLDSPTETMFVNPARQTLQFCIYAEAPLEPQQLTATLLPGLSHLMGWDLVLVYAAITAVYTVFGMRHMKAI